ncbi:TatD family hydrolase [Patescibacteria group bacterium]|nr:TatD family hydrolase [Patescibacteria group bacterium]
MLFDSHAHLSHAIFDEYREEIIKKLQTLEIKIVNIGVGSDEFENEKIVAIGECGLDYYRNLENKNLQKEVFIKQIELAEELGKPLIIHCRPTLGTMDAYEDALNILNTCRISRIFGAGIAHFFSGSKEIAKKFLDLGFYISFAGPITFSDQYKEIVEYIPNNRILAETDSPFAAPLPFRGKRNEPAFVEFVVRQIADWKGISFEEARRLTTENAENLFCLKTPF